MYYLLDAVRTEVGLVEFPFALDTELGQLDGMLISGHIKDCNTRRSWCHVNHTGQV
jgi:hypothetical protein